MGEKIKVYSSHRPGNIVLDFGDEFEIVTHLGENGNYLIVDSHFFPVVGKTEVLRIVNRLIELDHFDLCFLSELMPKEVHQGRSLESSAKEHEDLSFLDKELSNQSEDIKFLMKSGNRLHSLCMFWKRQRVPPKDPKVGCIHPPIFTHQSINPIAKIVNSLTEQVKSGTVDIEGTVSKYVDETTSESVKQELVEMLSSKLSTQTQKSSKNDKSSDSDEESKRSSNKSSNKSASSRSGVVENDNSAAAAAIVLVVIVIIVAAVFMAKRHN